MSLKLLLKVAAGLLFSIGLVLFIGVRSSIVPSDQIQVKDDSGITRLGKPSNIHDAKAGQDTSSDGRIRSEMQLDSGMNARPYQSNSRKQRPNTRSTSSEATALKPVDRTDWKSYIMP